MHTLAGRPHEDDTALGLGAELADTSPWGDVDESRNAATAEEGDTSALDVGLDDGTLPCGFRRS